MTSRAALSSSRPKRRITKVLSQQPKRANQGRKRRLFFCASRKTSQKVEAASRQKGQSDEPLPDCQENDPCEFGSGLHGRIHPSSGADHFQFPKAVFKIFCKCAKRGTQRISRARGLRLRACANAATASAAWPWQVAGEMLKWGTDGRPMKVLIPVTVGTISIAFSRRSVKAGVERTLSLRPRMVNRRSACQDT